MLTRPPGAIQTIEAGVDERRTQRRPGNIGPAMDSLGEVDAVAPALHEVDAQCAAATADRLRRTVSDCCRCRGSMLPRRRAPAKASLHSSARPSRAAALPARAACRQIPVATASPAPGRIAIRAELLGLALTAPSSNTLTPASTWCTACRDNSCSLAVSWARGRPPCMTVFTSPPWALMYSACSRASTSAASSGSFACKFGRHARSDVPVEGLAASLAVLVAVGLAPRGSPRPQSDRFRGPVP